MKLIFLTLSVLISGCSCCGSDVQYEENTPVITTNDRYIPVPEILIDGVTAPLTQEGDLGWTFSEVFTDSVTGRKVEVSGVIPKDTLFIPDKYSKFKYIHLAIRVPKDSVKTTDSSKTVTLKPIENKGFFDGITLKDLLIGGAILFVLFAVIFIGKQFGVIK